MSLKKAIATIKHITENPDYLITVRENKALKKAIIERVEGLMYDYDKRVQDYKTGFQEAISEVLDILKESK